MPKRVSKRGSLPAVISRRLRGLLIECELGAQASQRSVAREIGIPAMVWNRTLRGQSCPTAETLVRIADFFEVSTDELLGRS